MIRVLLVDDHKLLRQALRRLLSVEPDIEVVGDAGNGLEGQQLAWDLKPDVILMDISMPTLGGISATREIIRNLPDAKIIMLTMHKEDANVLQAVRAGAVGYILKSDGVEAVIAAVRAAASGGSAIDPDLNSQILKEFRRLAAKQGADEELGLLTDVDISLLRLIAAGLSNKEMADRLSYARSTVKNRVSVLFQKIGVADRTQAAIYAMHHGIVFLADEGDNPDAELAGSSTSRT